VTASTPPPLTAVVVTYRSARTLSPALAALRASHDAGLLDCVVVDNASTDATRAILAREAGWATVVLQDGNHGFGRGCNAGLARVRTPFTVFVNPDAEVGPDALRTMLAFLQANPRVGIVGPATRIGAENGAVLQHTGPRPRPFHILQGQTRLLGRVPPQRDIVPGSAPFRTGWVCGAVLMARTELLQRLGGFDPTFFLYWEEMDLCQRVEDAGFEVWAVGTAIARHACGASSADDDAARIQGCLARHYFPSRRHYLVKHHGFWTATAVEIAELGLLLAMTAVDVVRGRGAGRLWPRLQAPLFTRPRPLGALGAREP
jgi:N-acetylglucosaminyl-diphospho-decaprenol L-rhamnosyltransferase